MPRIKFGTPEYQTGRTIFRQYLECAPLCNFYFEINFFFKFIYYSLNVIFCIFPRIFNPNSQTNTISIHPLSVSRPLMFTYLKPKNVFDKFLMKTDFLTTKPTFLFKILASGDDLEITLRDFHRQLPYYSNLIKK